MSYEDLLIESTKDELIVKEAPLTSADGRLDGNRIAIVFEPFLTVIEKF